MEQKNSDDYQADASGPALSEKFNEPDKHAEERARLGDLFQCLDYLMRAGHWGTLNAFFAEQRLDDPIVVIVGAMRLCFPMRDRLPEWTKLVGVYYETLKARGENPDRILRGLLCSGAAESMNFSNEAEGTGVSLKSDTSLKDSEA